MPRKKKIKVNNTPVKIRFKSLADGTKSIILDYFVNGKRVREYLHLYLVPEVDAIAKQQNQNTMQDAKMIQAQRINELADGTAGIKKASKYSKMLLLDWVRIFKEKKLRTGQSKSNAVTINNLSMHLQAYRGDKVMIKDVDKEYCEGFITYLSKAKAFGTNKLNKETGVRKPMAKTTARLYFNTFVSCLNEAVRCGVIDSNPTAKLSPEDKKPIKPDGEKRTYLTIDEVKKLIATPYEVESVKRAFLFACFCGLRISDIRGLQWGNIKNENGGYVVKKTMVKTRQQVSVPLSDEALGFLPDRAGAKDSDPVFDLPTGSGVTHDVEKWAKAAGINKNVCFHVSRHTFATTLLTLGADLYTTSQLLGHQNIRTTQIYAEIVNQKKVDAVNLFGKAFNSSNQD
jgi:integrase